MAPALTELSRFKRLAELFVLAMKAEPFISVDQNREVIYCLMEHGLSEKDAEQFLEDAFERYERGMVRSLEQTLVNIQDAFYPMDHPTILTEVQNILESGRLDDNIQTFFDLCSKHLYTKKE